MLLICSKLYWDRMLSLDILAVIAKRYCHYGDDLDNLATLETADVLAVIGKVTRHAQFAHLQLKWCIKLTV